MATVAPPVTAVADLLVGVDVIDKAVRSLPDEEAAHGLEHAHVEEGDRYAYREHVTVEHHPQELPGVHDEQRAVVELGAHVRRAVGRVFVVTEGVPAE